MEATIARPTGIAVDLVGNLFTADAWKQLAAKVGRATRAVETLAGIGTWGCRGDGGQASLAQLARSLGMAANRAGNVHGVRRIDSLIEAIETVL